MVKILGERSTRTNWLERMLTNPVPSVEIMHGNLSGHYQAVDLTVLGKRDAANSLMDRLGYDRLNATQDRIQT